MSSVSHDVFPSYSMMYPENFSTQASILLDIGYKIGIHTLQDFKKTYQLSTTTTIAAIDLLFLSRYSDMMSICGSCQACFNALCTIMESFRLPCKLLASKCVCVVVNVIVTCFSKVLSALMGIGERLELLTRSS